MAEFTLRELFDIQVMEDEMREYGSPVNRKSCSGHRSHVSQCCGCRSVAGMKARPSFDPRTTSGPPSKWWEIQ